MNNKPKASGGTPVMIKWALCLLILGFVNAVIGIAVTFQLNSQRPPDLLALRAWEHAIIWLWPGGIVMMVEPKNRVIEALGLVWSVLVNGCLYSMVGLAAGALWQRLGRARDRSR